MQDRWIGYPRNGETERTMGTTLRYFDDKTKLWRVVFVSPKYGSAVSLRGGVEGDRLVLRGTDADGVALRWSFNEIEPNSFIWRGEASRDGGKTWRLEEEHHMKRRAAGGR